MSLRRRGREFRRRRVEGKGNNNRKWRDLVMKKIEMDMEM